MSPLATLLFTKPAPLPVSAKLFRMGKPSSPTPLSDETEILILKELRTDAGLKITELAQRTGRSIGRLKPALASLEEKGIAYAFHSAREKTVLYCKEGVAA